MADRVLPSWWRRSEVRELRRKLSVSGRMGEQGGLRTGWIAAFGTEGYDGEPPLLEELGVNFDHIRSKARFDFFFFFFFRPYPEFPRAD